MAKSVVSIIRDEDLRARILEALRLIGDVGRVVKKGDRVLIKPNMADGLMPDSAETTSPEVVRYVAEKALEAGAGEVVIGEGEAGDIFRGGRARLLAWYERVAEETGLKLINFNDFPYDEVPVPNPVYFKTIRLARPILECDVYISVPVLKTHHLCGLTVGLKNLYGAFPIDDRHEYHRIDRTEESVVDANSVRAPDLVVVDGTWSTHHLPPLEKHRLDLCIAGVDPVAVDAASAKTIGVEPRTLRTLAWAQERGLGTADLDEIQIVGITIAEAYRRHTLTNVDVCNRKHERLKLVNGEACTGCFGRISTALSGFDDSGFKEKTYVLIGPKARPPSEGRVIMVGNCLAPTFYNNLKGSYLPGCPPDLQGLEKQLESLDEA